MHNPKFRYTAGQPMSIDTFRTANASDAQSIAALVNSAYRPEPGAAGWTDEGHLLSGERISAIQVGEVVARRDSIILLGLKDSAIVACVHVEKQGDNSQIGMLAVQPKLQNAGIGKQMLAHAESHAIENFGAKKLLLRVVTGRPDLVAYYQRRGYQPTGCAIDFPLAGGVGIPKVPDLKIEVLEKYSNSAVPQDAPQAASLGP